MRACKLDLISAFRFCRKVISNFTVRQSNRTASDIENRSGICILNIKTRRCALCKRNEGIITTCLRESECTCSKRSRTITLP